MSEQRPVMQTVYVVAWRYNGGGGFDWYYTTDAADHAYEQEKRNADEFAAQEWIAYRFDYQSATGDPTDEIDYALDDLCDSTPIRYPAE